MKFKIFFLVLTLSIINSSCKKNDDTTSPENGAFHNDNPTMIDDGGENNMIPSDTSGNITTNLSNFNVFARWENLKLKYYFKTDDGNPDLDERKIIQVAFNVWSEVSDLEFEEVSNESAADIKIKWGNIASSSTLGRAQTTYNVNSLFILNSEINFNNSIQWVDNLSPNYPMYDLLQVAIHEIGHSLGINHSEIEPAIMYDFYKGQGQRHLHQDDINAIQSQYPFSGVQIEKKFFVPVSEDFNNDGYPDVAYFGKCGASGEECWRVHINTQNGEFDVENYGWSGWRVDNRPIHTPITGDFNNDGYRDIAYYGKCGNGEDCWRVNINNQSGGFDTVNFGDKTWSEGSRPIHTPISGDFNNDGYTDIAYYGFCGNGDKCWRVHINTQNGEFDVEDFGDKTWSEGSRPIHTPISGDFNNDGYTDIAYYGFCGNGDKCWRVHINTQNGEFDVEDFGDKTWSEGSRPIHTPISGDFNNDGYTDIAYYGFCGNGDKCWRVHINTQNGEFDVEDFGDKTWSEGSVLVHTPMSADFNNDGYADIAYYGKCGNGEDCWRIHINIQGAFDVENFGDKAWFSWIK